MALVDLKVFRDYVARVEKDFTDVPLRVLRDIYLIASVRYYIDDESDVVSDGTFDNMCRYMVSVYDNFKATFHSKMTKEDLIAGTGCHILEEDLSDVQLSILRKLRDEEPNS